jgi:glycerol 2-dehydrogenase (NADP+)
VALPKSVTPARIASNFTGALAGAEKLDAADIEHLDGLAAGGKQKRSAVPAIATYGCVRVY